jgi:hypothetical protein
MSLGRESELSVRWADAGLYVKHQDSKYGNQDEPKGWHAAANPHPTLKINLKEEMMISMCLVYGDKTCPPKSLKASSKPSTPASSFAGPVQTSVRLRFLTAITSHRCSSRSTPDMFFSAPRTLSEYL